MFDWGFLGTVLGVLAGGAALVGAVMGIGGKITELDQIKKDLDKDEKHIDEIFTRLETVAERVARVEGKIGVVTPPPQVGGVSTEPEPTSYEPPTASPSQDTVL